MRLYLSRAAARRLGLPSGRPRLLVARSAVRKRIAERARIRVPFASRYQRRLLGARSLKLSALVAWTDSAGRLRSVGASLPLSR